MIHLHSAFPAAESKNSHGTTTLRTAMVRSGILRPDEVGNCSIKHMLCGNTSGSEEKKASTGESIIAPYHGDRLLLATDGITGVLSEEATAGGNANRTPIRTSAEELVSRAARSGLARLIAPALSSRSSVTATRNRKPREQRESGGSSGSEGISDACVAYPGALC